jgi:hypothetical protein
MADASGPLFGEGEELAIALMSWCSLNRFEALYIEQASGNLETIQNMADIYMCAEQTCSASAAQISLQRRP